MLRFLTVGVSRVDTMTDPELGLRWLNRVKEQAAEVRRLQGMLALELENLDRDLLVASRLIGVSDLAEVSGLSRVTVYKAIDRAQAKLNAHERAADAGAPHGNE